MSFSPMEQIIETSKALSVILKQQKINEIRHRDL